MTDKQIIDMLFGRDDKAIAELNNSYGSLFRQLAGNILADYEDVEDCINDTYFKVWNSIPPKNPEYLCAYVCKIVRNNALNMLKAKTSQKRGSNNTVPLAELEECLPSQSTVDESIDEKHLTELLNSWLMKQNELSRRLFVRRYFAMESVEELSKSCSMSKNSVSVKLHRLRNSLKKYLESEGISV
ncbi:MAG: sigma-70 family RNA polymerase sigma factor [Eubacterium sp.]|nr:sigma-70 family RNA polymerase sigma factor [Eubacterium sp.]